MKIQKFPKSSLILTFLVLFLGCGSVSTGNKAPNFTLTNLEGEEISLSSLKGEVVFLDFWATWCPPCIVSGPEVAKLEQEYESKKVHVLSISLDENEDRLRSFVKSRGFSKNVFWAGKTDLGQIYEVSGIPTFIIIDQNGEIVNKWSGYHPLMTKLWRKELDELLKV